MTIPFDTFHEWLETDGTGGFASGTVGGALTRRSHALLSRTRRDGSRALVSTVDTVVTSGNSTLRLPNLRPEAKRSDELYGKSEFVVSPWPTWIIPISEDVSLRQEFFLVRELGVVVLKWSLSKPRKQISLTVRPLLSWRDPGSLQHTNDSFSFDATVDGERLCWRPYEEQSALFALTNGTYSNNPLWYDRCFYREEHALEHEAVEDLASPGEIRWDLSSKPAYLVLSYYEEDFPNVLVADLAEGWVRAERTRREAFATPLELAANAYTVRGTNGSKIVSSYPSTGEWARDSLIALRGFYIATGKLEHAADLLCRWAQKATLGMIPCRFPSARGLSELNSVDATLWFVAATRDLFEQSEKSNRKIDAQKQETLRQACEAALQSYSTGARYQIGMDEDGLLSAGVIGMPLTWMDAKIGDWVVTPRIGKPVEVQALWLNALDFVSGFSPRWLPTLERALESFRAKFWNEERKALYDVVDRNHEEGIVDDSFRPNQIFAAGALPFTPLPLDRAKLVVAAVEKHLYTPVGLRTLAPFVEDYRARYEGSAREREHAYHQGTAWPWLMAPFVEAWVKARGNSPDAKLEARHKFLNPLLKSLEDAGVGHLSELADGEPPYTSRGCPFHAVSLAELIRLKHSILGEGSLNREVG